MLEREVNETEETNEVPVNESSNSEKKDNIEDYSADDLGLSEKDYEEIIGKKKKSVEKKQKKAEGNEGKKDNPKKESKNLPPEQKDGLDELLKDSEDVETKEDSETETDEAENDEENSETEDDEELEELIHDNQKVKVSKEELKNLAQKGYDYTKKTQALAEERKQFLAEKTEYESEADKLIKGIQEEDAKRNESIETYKKFDIAIDLLKEDGNEEVLAVLAQYMSKASRLSSNPVVDSKVQSLQSKIEAMENELKGQKHQARLSAFYSEMSELKKSETGKRLESIGLKIDEDAIKKVWASSNDLTARQALQAVHGEQIAHLVASKNKVATSQELKKLQNKVKTVGSSRAPSRNGVGKLDISKMSQNQILDAVRNGSYNFEELAAI